MKKSNELNKKIAEGEVMETNDRYGDIVSRLLQGDLSMQEGFNDEDRTKVLAHILDSRNFGKDELSHLFKILVSENPNHNLGVGINLGILAARAGAYPQAEAFALDLFKDDHLRVALVIAWTALQDENNEMKENFEEILGRVAATGHFYTRSVLLGRKFRKYGIFGFFPLIVCRIVLALQTTYVALKNPKDKRLNRFPGDKFMGKPI